MMLAVCLKLRVCECAEDANGGAVGGGAGDEAAVGVEVEVVAGADGGVHVYDGDAVGEGLGGLGGGCCGEGREEEGSSGEEMAGDAGHVSFAPAGRLGAVPADRNIIA
jgi:hypothetical protein